MDKGLTGLELHEVSEVYKWAVKAQPYSGKGGGEQQLICI